MLRCKQCIPSFNLELVFIKKSRLHILFNLSCSFILGCGEVYGDVLSLPHQEGVDHYMNRYVAIPSSFKYTISPLNNRPDIVSLVSGVSLKLDSPVGADLLVYMELSYYDLNGMPQYGELIVHRDEANRIKDIFEDLFNSQFPIEKMRLVDRYLHPGESIELVGDSQLDERSMSDNNTYAFYARKVSNSDRWSNHAYGKAIDINPRVNPYVRLNPDGAVVYFAPQSGADYVQVDRADSLLSVQGVHTAMGSISILERHGWEWGGGWHYSDGVRDNHHFSCESRYAHDTNKY